MIILTMLAIWINTVYLTAGGYRPILELEVFVKTACRLALSVISALKHAGM